MIVEEIYMWKKYMENVDPDVLRLALKGACSYYEMMQQLRNETEKKQEESEKSTPDGVDSYVT